MHVLDEISKSVPDRLWLNEMTQTGSEFTINGTTDSLTAVADYAANLLSKGKGLTRDRETALC